MTAVELSIVEPEHDKVFTGAPNVTFRGTAQVPAELSGIELHYRWYSNQYSSGADDRYSMNEPAQSSAEQAFSTILGPGTHAIGFAVSDVPGESKSDFESVEHGGVTGGTEGNGKCIIHVFKANILLPAANSSVNHSAVVLQAEAPAQWGVSEDEENGGPPYVANEDYHAINRLQYRWRFVPTGNPAGRPEREYIPEPEHVDFLPKDDGDAATDPTRVQFTVSLPSGATGAYQITLYVEDKENEKPQKHSQTISVNLT